MKKNVWDLDLQPSTPRPGMKSLFQAISAIIHSQILEVRQCFKFYESEHLDNYNRLRAFRWKIQGIELLHLILKDSN